MVCQGQDFQLFSIALPVLILEVLREIQADQTRDQNSPSLALIAVISRPDRTLESCQ